MAGGSRGGAFSWWSPASIFEAAGKPYAMTPNGWYHSWWPWWAKILARLGYPTVRARRAAPTKQSTCAADVVSSVEFDLRVLPKYSLSAYALLALLPRWCKVKGRGGAKAEKAALARSAFTSLLLSTYVVGQKWMFCLRLDDSAQAQPGLPITGEGEVQLPVDIHGCVDVSTPKASSHRLAALLLKAFPENEKLSLQQVRVAWCSRKKLEFAFSRLVWHLETSVKESLEEVLPADKASRGQLGVQSFNTIGKKFCKFQRRQRMPQYFYAGRQAFDKDLPALSCAADASRIGNRPTLPFVPGEPQNTAVWAPPMAFMGPESTRAALQRIDDDKALRNPSS